MDRDFRYPCDNGQQYLELIFGFGPRQGLSDDPVASPPPHPYSDRVQGTGLLPPQAGFRTFRPCGTSVSVTGLGSEIRGTLSKLRQAVRKALPIGDIAICRLQDACSGTLRQNTRNFARHANHQRIVRNYLALYYKRIGTNDAV